MTTVQNDESSEVSLLVVSPLADNIAHAWGGRKWRDFQTATTPQEALRAMESKRKRFDVVLVDLLWNDFECEWTFDGLDLLVAMAASGKNEWVIFSCQGHGFERDHLEEAYYRMKDEGQTSQIRGLMLKANLAEALETVLAVARGEIEQVTPEIKARVRPKDQTIDYWFQRSIRMPRLAGAIAAGHRVNYKSLVKQLGGKRSYLHKSPALFRPLLPVTDHPDDGIALAEVARWCGEHAHYILSWCRRYGPDKPNLGPNLKIFERIVAIR